LPGTFLEEISRFAEEEKFAETESGGSAGTHSFVPKIRCFAGKSSQAGALQSASQGVAVKPERWAGLGISGGAEQLLTSASRVVSAG